MEKFWKCPPVGSQMGSGKLDTTDAQSSFPWSARKKYLIN